MSIEIESPASPDLIPEALKPVIARFSDLYLETFGPRLQSIYLLGGATRGEYRPGISDFDFRAIVTTKEEGEKEKVDELAVPLQQEFNLGILELDVYTLSGINKRKWLQFYVLVDGVCVWGKPYEGTLPLPTSKEDLAKILASQLLGHYEKIPESLEMVRTGKIEGNPETWRTHAKRAIRMGNAISILKTGFYTQNSERMVRNILINVPEIVDPITRLNQYRIIPPATLEEYMDLLKQAEIVRTTVLSYGLGINDEEIDS